MIEFMRSVSEIMTVWLEPVGIIAGLFFSGVSLRNDTRARRIENHIKISNGYREIWSTQVADPKLDRILVTSLDLVESPISQAEAPLVRFIFQNILLAFEARQAVRR